MALYPYVATLAVDPQTLVKAAGATGVIYAPTDTTFASPLTATDATGNPIPLTSNVDGILPSFYATLPAVNWRSGAYTFPLVTSQPIPGDKGDDGEPGLDGSNVIPTAQAIATEIQTAGTPANTALGVALAPLASKIEASAQGVEITSAVMLGVVPRLDNAPPTVTVTNNQTLDGTGSPVNATSLITDRKANAAGWYTTVSPTDLTVQRYFAPSAPIHTPTAPSPDKWSVSFKHGGLSGSSFSHEARVSGGQIIQYMVKQMAGGVFRILVNGKYLTPTHQVIGGAAGQMAFITVDFGAPLTVAANITFEGSAVPFYGVIHQNASTISKVIGPNPKKIIFAGDSYWQSSGEVTQLTPMSKTAAWLLGYRGYVNSSIGGSGYLANGNQGQPSLGGRVTEDIVGQAPDVVVVGMGHNDASFTDAAIQSAAGSAVQAIRAGLPNALIIVTGPMFSTAAAGRYASMQTAIFAGVAGVSGVKTVDTVTTPWITTGNRPKYISTDGTHPVQIGSDYFGHRLAAAIAEATAVRF